MNETISAHDRGLAYGDGLFETIAYVNSKLNHWNLHWLRLQRGANKLKIDLPDEIHLIEQIQLKIKQENSSHSLNKNGSEKSWVIKIILTRGQGGRGYLAPSEQKPTLLISLFVWPERSEIDYTHGIRATVCQTCLAIQPALSGIKHLNRLEQVLGRNEFAGQSFSEGIMLSCSEPAFIVEGTSSNLFFVSNGRLHTPIIDTCGVEGTMKQPVVHLAQQLNMPIVEKQCYLDELNKASEIFFTNSIFGILPVSFIQMRDTLEWNFVAHEYKTMLTPKLAAILNKTINRPHEVLFN